MYAIFRSPVGKIIKGLFMNIPKCMCLFFFFFFFFFFSISANDICVLKSVLSIMVQFLYIFSNVFFNDFLITFSCTYYAGHFFSFLHFRPFFT